MNKEPKTQGKIVGEISKIFVKRFNMKGVDYYDALEDLLSLFQKEQQDQLQRVIELIGEETDIDYKGKILCDCPCLGPQCNTFFHACKKPNKHILQVEKPAMDIRNKLRKQLKTKISQMGEELK